MAVSDDLPGVEVEIVVKGKALKEYKEEHIEEDERTTTRYIEATSGQEFAIRMKLRSSFKFKGDCIAFYIGADGQSVDGIIISEEDRKHKRVSEGREEDGGFVRKYRLQI